MAFAQAGGASAVRAAINITPLVDVVLVLLIIFMVLSPTVLKETDLHIPEETTVDRPVSSEDQLEVHIASDGAVTIGELTVETERVAPTIRSLLAGRPSATAFFDIDERAPFGRAVEVMDLCRGAGVTTLGMTPRREVP